MKHQGCSQILNRVLDNSMDQGLLVGQVKFGRRSVREYEISIGRPFGPTPVLDLTLCHGCSCYRRISHNRKAMWGIRLTHHVCSVSSRLGLRKEYQTRSGPRRPTATYSANRVSIQNVCSGTRRGVRSGYRRSAARGTRQVNS